MKKYPHKLVPIKPLVIIQLFNALQCTLFPVTEANKIGAMCDPPTCTMPWTECQNGRCDCCGGRIAHNDKCGDYFTFIRSILCKVLYLTIHMEGLRHNLFKTLDSAKMF